MLLKEEEGVVESRRKRVSERRKVIWCLLIQVLFLRRVKVVGATKPFATSGGLNLKRVLPRLVFHRQSFQVFPHLHTSVGEPVLPERIGPQLYKDESWKTR